MSACTQATIYGFAPEDLRTAVEIIDGNIKALRRGCRPYDTMQQIAVRLYLDQLLEGKGKMDASETAVLVFPDGRSYKARLIRLWANLILRGEELPVDRRGRHPKSKSLIYDEDVKSQCLDFLRSLNIKEVDPTLKI